MAIVYITTNKITGTKYLGKKVKDHVSYLGSGIYLNHAITKYGKENFEKKIICIVERDEAARIERELSIIWSVFNDRERWYNLRPGGNGGSTPGAMKGRKLSQETKDKISIANRGKRRTPGQRKKMSEAFKGRTHTDEYKRKMSQKLTGRVLSESHKQKLRVAKSAEHKQKIGAAHLGKIRGPLSNETKDKLSLALSGPLNPMYGVGRPEIAMKATIASLRRLTCPHCGVSSSTGNAKRWHFDNCKERRQNEENIY